MSSPHRVAIAIRNLGQQLAELVLPEETDEAMTLVLQQQQLLEAYARSTPPNDIDYQLIREVSSENQRLIGRVKQAHRKAAQELDALARSRSAVSAYAGNQSEPMRA